MKTLIYLLVLLPLISLADDINVKKLSENSYLLSGKDYGTNIGVIAADERVILIDPMPGEAHLKALKSTVQKLFGKPVGYILNTHVHEDHSGGNDYFIAQGGQALEKFPNDKHIEQFTAASHSSSDNIFYHKSSNAIFVGDIFDNSWHPTFYYGNIKGFNAAIDLILKIGDSKSLIIPGHGEPSNKQHLIRYRENTEVWINKIKQLHREKTSINNIMDNKEVRKIIQRFNTQNKKPFIPEKALERFIQRTITAIESQ